MGKPLTGWPAVWALGITGAMIGFIFGGSLDRTPALKLRTKTVYSPAAYQLPKYPGGTSLRIAMIHDVLVDRYLTHGSQWYEKRNALSRAIIATDPPTAGSPSIRRLEAMDDLAVGLENLHRSDEAAEVMREKLKLLPPLQLKSASAAGDVGLEMDGATLRRNIKKAESLTPEMHHQYTARANLGTSLVHASFPRLLAGDATAGATMEEGLQQIQECIRINPIAHFGRENWQAIVIQHFLAVADQPNLATRFDMVGDSLAMLKQESDLRSVAFLNSFSTSDDSSISDEQRVTARTRIFRVGMDQDWHAAIGLDAPGPVPFDEPTLGLIGMWMFGGGPNPHSALALANIAFQISQNEIAWEGYERAQLMQERFSGDPIIREKLVAFCKRQQQRIAASESPASPGRWTENIRRRFTAELTWGQGYQAAYHAWEGSQIEAGVPLDSPTFYDAFNSVNAPIASPPGFVDFTAVRFYNPDGFIDALPLALLAGGVGMLLAAVTVKPATSSP